ncbi:MAG: hypothetical protein ACI4SL_10260 [Candidatus Ornithospirochaeta sp.]
MSEKIKSKGRFGTLISIVCFCVIGLGCGIAVTPLIDYFLEGDGNIFIAIMGLLLMISLMYIAIFLEMAIHEAGHLVFGLLTGYKFVSYRIASFTFIKEEGKLKVKKFSLPGTGGQCLMSPPEYSSSMPYVLYNAGGAIFNFLSFALFLLLFYIFSAVPFLSSFLLMTAFISLGLGAMNIIPFIYGNDGSNIMNIHRSEIEKKSFWAQMEMAGKQLEGLRLKDMEEEVFPVRKSEEIEGIMSSSALAYYESRLLDEGEFEKALSVSKEALSSPLLPGVLKTAMKCDEIYLLLVLGKDKKEIDAIKDKKLIKEMNGMKGMLFVMRCEYAYALLYEENGNKAIEIRKVFDTTSESYPSPSEVEGERYLMDKAYELYEEY